MSSIDSPPAREKFSLLNTVMTIFWEQFTPLRRCIKRASLEKLCATLVGFNSAEPQLWYSFYGDVISHLIRGEGTESLVLEPILSHRLANLAILCMQYLHRLDFDILQTQNKFLASWATRSKQLPWLWRRRMRVTLMRPRRPIWDHDGHKGSSPRKLRRPRQIIYSGTIQSHQEQRIFYSGTIQSHQKQRIFYTWTLDLLYHTLRKAMKSDMLTTALSKPFIPSPASILFPRRVKRVRKAAVAYLEKVSRKSSLGRSDDESLHS